MAEIHVLMGTGVFFYSSREVFITYLVFKHQLRSDCFSKTRMNIICTIKSLLLLFQAFKLIKQLWVHVYRRAVMLLQLFESSSSHGVNRALCHYIQVLLFVFSFSFWLLN